MDASPRLVVLVPLGPIWWLEVDGVGRARAESRQDAVDKAMAFAREESPSRVQVLRGDGTVESEWDVGAASGRD